MKRSGLLFVWVWLLIQGAGLQAAFQRPFISGRNLWNSNSELFSLRAIAYSPTPIGSNSPTHSTLDAAVLRRDGPLLRAAGANAIRIYGGLQISTSGVVSTGVTSQFLNEAASNGLWVIVGSFIPNSLDFSSPSIRNLILNAHSNLVSTFRHHENILMWAIGNEVNQGLSATQRNHWYSLVNDLAGGIKQWPGPAPFVTCVNGTIGTNTSDKFVPHDSLAPNLDLWGINIYNGSTFGMLFEEVENNTQKPFWIAEAGIDSFDRLTGVEDQLSQAQFAEALWAELITQRQLLIGGVLGFYSDEWWKDTQARMPGRHDTGGNAIGNGPDNHLSEEWLGIFSVTTNAQGYDQVIPKLAYYTLKRLWLGDCPCTSVANPARFFSSYNALNPFSRSFNSHGGLAETFVSNGVTTAIRNEGPGASGQAGDRALHVTGSYLPGGHFGIAEPLSPKSSNAVASFKPRDLGFFDRLSFDVWVGSSSAERNWTVRLEDTVGSNQENNAKIPFTLSTNVQTITIALNQFLRGGTQFVDLSRVKQIVFQVSTQATSNPVAINLFLDNLRIYKAVPANTPFSAALAKSPHPAGFIESSISFPFQPGWKPSVEYSTNLATGSWNTLPGAPHEGCVRDLEPSNLRFYRVRR